MERKPINSSLKFVNYIVNEVQFNYNKNQKDEKNWKLTFNFKNITKLIKKKIEWKYHYQQKYLKALKTHHLI